MNTLVLIASVLTLLGIILIVYREGLRKAIVLKDDIGAEKKDSEYGGRLKEIIIMDPKDYPHLLRVNGGIVGEKMSGRFARKDAPVLYYASYNCFSILYCPIIPLGCYLIHENMKGVSCYGKLKTEKDELLFVLAKGWGILLIIVGIVLLIFGLSA